MFPQRILIAFFSWTNNTRTIAQEIEKNLSFSSKVDTCEICPIKTRRYLTWLFLSSIPRFKVKIQSKIYDLSNYDMLILGSPKWVFNSPPINEYLNRLIGCRGQMTAIFITYGGYGEKKYAMQLEKNLEKKKLHVIDTLLIRRRSIKKGEYFRDVQSFCKYIEQIVYHNELKRIA